ncbi:hypothetical protein ACJJTC_007754 [Scirpophaga incertulas]
MNGDEIEILSKTDSLEDVFKILHNFLINNEKILKFPMLSVNGNRIILWTALFQHLQKTSFESIHHLCLGAMRILSRDKEELDKILCEKWIIILVEKSGLYNYVNLEEASTPIGAIPKKEIVIESLKALCNISFNSEVARDTCANTSVDQALIGRLRVFKDVPFKDEVMIYDMKLLFILTALRDDVKRKVKYELHGLDYLLSGLNELLLEASIDLPAPSSSSKKDDLVQGLRSWYLQDGQQAIACEIFKVLFNLISYTPPHSMSDEEQEAIYLKLMPVLTSMLCAQTTNHIKLMDLRSNIANLLTSVPSNFYSYLTLELTQDEVCQYEYDGKNMDALQSLIEFLQFRLSNVSCIDQQFEQLSPIVSVMLKSARACRSQRKYLRQIVLPPLRDVSTPPEKGDTLRNMLCKHLTTPVTKLRDLVAEFLFVLCKEKVGRMVKYTGFGNAAGHLAQQGLLGGARGAKYSSSSDDSDTEEYRLAEPHIDPVVGCTRPPRANPLEGMTDEQKEHEAMKLVNLFDKMLSEGVVRPARIGPDGRPQPVEHVLELRDNAPNRPQS